MEQEEVERDLSHVAPVRLSESQPDRDSDGPEARAKARAQDLLHTLRERLLKAVADAPCPATLKFKIQIPNRFSHPRNAKLCRAALTLCMQTIAAAEVAAEDHLARIA